MASRVGVELSSTAWRIVELSAGSKGRRGGPDTRVESFAILPPGTSELRAAFDRLRSRPAAVVVWGASSEHRQVIVSNRNYDAMRREALAALTGVGIETRGVVADIAPAGVPGDGGKRRPVVVALASASAVSTAIAPLTAAGVRVRTVTTPAAALAVLARLRRDAAVPGALDAYVALEETATCVALVRDGALVTARELPWGFVTAGSRGELTARDDVARRLADELALFLATIGLDASALRQVCVCGAIPDLRSMTVPLMERLDVEVEPLDSLYGIDSGSLPHDGSEFRERSAELRVAWAAAADWPGAINLLRAKRRETARTALSRAAVVAGLAAAVAGGWRIQHSAWWRSIAAPPSVRTASNAPPAAKPFSPPPAAAAPPAGARENPPQPGAARASNPPHPLQTSPTDSITARSQNIPAQPQVQPPTRGQRPPQLTRSSPGPVPPSRATPQTSSQATKPERSSAPPAAPRGVSTPVQPPAVVRTVPSTPQPETRGATPSAPPARAAVKSVAGSAETSSGRYAMRVPERRAAARAAPAETPLPFDATLGTILYSPDRKLAIIDGRIVGIGDEVRGARVTDITPSAVLLRDPQGRLRRLALSPGGR